MSAELEAAFREASPESRPELLRGITDRQAASTYAAQRASGAWAPQFDLFVPALASCALLLMVKDEDDIIGENLEHHYRLGFRRFFILDNASTDQTAARIAAFRAGHADAGVFCAYDFIVGYYQEAKTRAMATFAEAYLASQHPGLDWIFYLDADEFITCCAADAPRAAAAFSGILADPACRVMVFHWVQCSSLRPLASIIGEYVPQRMFPQHWRALKPTVPKVAHRVRCGLQTIQGNHQTDRFDDDMTQAAVMAGCGFYLLHYPMRTVAQLRKKIVNGGRAYEAAPDLIGLGNHWKAYYQLYQRHGDAFLLRLLQEHVEACR